jgi:CCR4-NOT transcriptional regulation complex NOT5 subunit
MRAGLEAVAIRAAEGERTAMARQAAAVASVKESAALEASEAQSAAAAALSQCQEERGEAILRADQMTEEATRLREMVGQLKRHDDELYASQSGAAAELRQMHSSLASAEERIAAGRMALEEESSRRLEAERRLEVARSERATLLARAEGGEEAQAALAELRVSSAAALAQYKEDNAVLVS